MAESSSMEGNLMSRETARISDRRRKRRRSKRETAARQAISPAQTHAFVDELFGTDLHAKRVRSLADGAIGVLRAAALGIHAIGRGLAAAKGLVDKHAIKQVDRCIGNEAIDPEALAEQWVRRALQDRATAFINLDWTEFDADDHSMLVLSLQTFHGRSLPLLWKTVVKSEMKNQRNNHEDALLARLSEIVPLEVRVVIVADRGFGDQKLFRWLQEELGFDFIIRIRAGIQVTSASGECRSAGEWVGKNGRMRTLKHAFVTQDLTPVGQVVVVQDRGMKDIWCLVVSEPSWSGMLVKKQYGKRFSCEENFRDIKDLRYGMGMSWNRISQVGRRDRMMLLAVLAQALLTLLGQAGEEAGLDRLLKSNTRKKRTLSLLRQGLRWYELLPTMPDKRLHLLMKYFERLIKNDPLFSGLLVTDHE